MKILGYYLFKPKTIPMHAIVSDILEEIGVVKTQENYIIVERSYLKALKHSGVKEKDYPRGKRS